PTHVVSRIIDLVAVLMHCLVAHRSQVANGSLQVRRDSLLNRGKLLVQASPFSTELFAERGFDPLDGVNDGFEIRHGSEGAVAEAVVTVSEANVTVTEGVEGSGRVGAIRVSHYIYGT